MYFRYCFNASTFCRRAMPLPAPHKETHAGPRRAAFLAAVSTRHYYNPLILGPTPAP